MITYGLAILILSTTVIVVWILAWILSNRDIAKYKQVKIDAWKRTLDVKNLIPDVTLFAEAQESWKWDFDKLLRIYMQATDSLGIKATSDVKTIETIMKDYPPFLTSKIYHKFEFENGQLKYHFINKTASRRLTVPLTEKEMTNPCFLSHDYKGKYYYQSGGWDY